MINVEEINPITVNNGPGIRVEVVLSNNSELSLTPNELVDRIRKFRPYIELNNGGVTFKGIFNNIEEISNACHICHKAGINTCIELIDYKEEYDIILKYIDIVILNSLDYIDKIYNKNIELFIRDNNYNNDLLNKYNIKIIDNNE